jgi:hypothetical protein
MRGQAPEVDDAFLTNKLNDMHPRHVRNVNKVRDRWCALSQPNHICRSSEFILIEGTIKLESIFSRQSIINIYDHHSLCSVDCCTG